MNLKATLAVRGSPFSPALLVFPGLYNLGRLENTNKVFVQGHQGDGGSDYTSYPSNWQESFRSLQPLDYNPNVSREHAMLYLTNQGLQICDLDSTNGTFYLADADHVKQIRGKALSPLQVGEHVLRLGEESELVITIASLS